MAPCRNEAVPTDLDLARKRGAKDHVLQSTQQRLRCQCGESNFRIAHQRVSLFTQEYVHQQRAHIMRLAHPRRPWDLMLTICDKVSF